MSCVSCAEIAHDAKGLAMDDEQNVNEIQGDETQILSDERKKPSKKKGDKRSTSKKENEENKSAKSKRETKRVKAESDNSV